VPDRALACKKHEAAGLGLTGLRRIWEELKIHDMKAVVLVGGLKLNFDVPTGVHALSREDHDHARIMARSQSRSYGRDVPGCWCHLAAVNSHFSL
jgi:hypothetical protein